MPFLAEMSVISAFTLRALGSQPSVAKCSLAYAHSRACQDPRRK